MIFDVSGATYRATPLDARSQFLLLGRLTPLLPSLDGVGRAVGKHQVGHIPLHWCSLLNGWF